MRTMPVTRQIDSSRPLSRTSRNACLVYIYPTGSALGMGTRHLLDKIQIVLGRGDDCDITVLDQSVSRRHTIFDLDVDGYIVTDLDSTNGTFVNDKPANRTPLVDGDYLRVGNCLFRFLAGGNVEADYHQELYRLAIVDALTGLYNRRYLIDYLERELARSARYHRPLALLMLDIDHFKTINDQLGHLAGDLTLRSLADCMRSEVRSDELLARYGGEEFAAVLAETDQAEAAEVAERIRLAVQNRPFDFEDQRYSVTVSLGVASVRADEVLPAHELIRQADERLYLAKRQGRNRVVF
jgi:two-component system, cell cycle response regulator